MNKTNIGIIGGGASGMLCAILIKKANLDCDVTIYERQDKIGKKLLQTGNGMCNITNRALEDYVTALDMYNNDFVKQAIKTFDLQTCLKTFESLGLVCWEDSEGRFYPYSRKATTVLNVLLKAIHDLDIKVMTNTCISAIQVCDDFSIYTDIFQLFHCDYLVIALGGKGSIAYNDNIKTLLTTVGHTVSKMYPALVALKTEENIKSLKGIRIKAKATMLVDDEVVYKTQGEIQFKEEGISGIAIMECSRFYVVDKNNYIELDLMAEKEEAEVEELLTTLYSNINNYSDVLLGIFPKMLVFDLVKRLKVLDSKHIAHLVKHYKFTIVDTYGFKNSQLTKGGIVTTEVNPFSFESLVNPKMYLLGEMLDVDGMCGGYNLHFAWASAYLAAQDIIRKIEE
ncbi:MAG: aminoacetone oxidase family FAD-binding enzyme [Bacilli bacterium]